MAKKWIYLFSEGNAEMRDLLGGKGAGLAEMTRTGVPVPPGFTITTDACNAYYDAGQKFPAGLWEQVVACVGTLEKQTGRRFADAANPLLVSVRSGAKFSMPGMMDTVLDLGLNAETLQGLAEQTKNPRFAYDAYRRFIQLFGKIVLGVDGSKFERALTRLKKRRLDSELTTEELIKLSETFKQIVYDETGSEFPEDPYAQLEQAIAAVFRSWFGRRAIDYRRHNHIPDTLGTAVNVQAMVFGNMGGDSATGVAFTRNPSTGEADLFGEYLVNAQGEDVVAGIRTPQPIAKLKEDMPAVYEQFKGIVNQLEQHYTDMQDVEFTIERGKLWMLQTRTGKRTGLAAVRIAVEMVEEGLISKATAVQRVDAESLNQLLHPMLDPHARAQTKPIGKGLPASPGAAVGKAVFDPDEAEKMAAHGERIILIRNETTPEDLHGMIAAKGLLTAHGGMTSHAAVVARGMGKPCVAGVGELHINYATQTAVLGDTTLKKGDWLTVNGTSGELFIGALPVVDPILSDEFTMLMAWADEFRTMGVRTNADIPRDAKIARQFGAEGIGLCRTEHMFFEGDRITAMREMILADTEEERRAALAKIEPLQQGDFEGLFREMDGHPVIIRTLDPPLHEFLPHGNNDIRTLAEKLGLSFQRVKTRVESLQEANPMLGLRGCRLGILYPEITEMQARAIFNAAVTVQREGITVYPEVMIPLVATVAELKEQADLVRRVAEEVQTLTGASLDYKIGTMIELPRAALVAHNIAEVAEFFSFGTNDLTQTTLGLSRDDAGRFLPMYVDHKIFSQDPFESIDQEGVGQLVRMATERGRATNPALEVGICGEHGGNPASVMFFYDVGLDYVSCSPFRVPVAKLAAAQAALAAQGALVKIDK
ncbi:MAG TPA: pyruvate, phosphate dikinase [Aggregatilineales bacterium]|nr:pyruvate, phosphate dikinase [Anaerolineales bacterium]HRE48243.1 pyruvate, phosphate dikinase [Aggregatilineales bacterium]